MKAGARRALLLLFPVLDTGVAAALPLLLTCAIVAAFCVMACVSIVEEDYPRVLMAPCILLTVVYCFPHLVDALARRVMPRRGQDDAQADATDPADSPAERSA